MYEEKEIFNFSRIEGLYLQAGIRRPEKSDYTVGFFDGDEPVACASIKGNILLGFAVSEKLRGVGLLPSLCTHLIKKGMEMGHDTFYIFTKPEKAYLFQACGFHEIVCASPFTSLLEWGRNSVGSFTQRLRHISSDKPEDSACIVMNANPFTFGHKYLVERAAMENKWLYILVVEAEKSVFPFDVRMDLIRKGTAEFSNISVLSGERYVISLLTFPTYFIKSGDVEVAQTELDLRLFCKHIAPALKIRKRYVGEEPYCKTTALYNKSMSRILPEYGIELVEIERKTSESGFISASAVRELIRQGKVLETKELLPDATFEFLNSPRGEEIIKRIKNTKSRHG